LERTRIKTLYIPDPEKVQNLPQPFFPPKWEINEICARVLFGSVFECRLSRHRIDGIKAVYYWECRTFRASFASAISSA
jgi:hypothetical protein